jgi:hypothetical protein
MIKDGRLNVQDEERSGRQSVVSDDLGQDVDQKICERRLFTILEFSCEFSQISSAVLYEIISQARISYVLRKMGSEHAHGCPQNAKNGFDFCRFLLE